MAVLDRLLRLTAAAAVVGLAAGCAGVAPDTEIGSRQTEAMEEIARTKEAADEGEGAQLPPTATDEDAVAAAASAATASPPADRTQPVHFPTGSPDDEAEQPTLFEASEAERLRRQESPKPASIVITNANLGEYAKGGQLSEMITEGFEQEDSAATTAASAPDPTTNPETYWRTRVRDGRLAWRAAADRAEELEKQVAQLRFDFYAQDDPAYRDGEIKPAWDRTAVELTQARLRVSDLESQVERILSEGLEAGALPGWLREGIDFEPASDRDEPGGDTPRSSGFDDAQVIEPPILEDPPK